MTKAKDAWVKNITLKSVVLVQTDDKKAAFYLNPESQISNVEWFGFKSNKSPKHIKELAKFENSKMFQFRIIKDKSLPDDIKHI